MTVKNVRIYGTNAKIPPYQLRIDVPPATRRMVVAMSIVATIRAAGA
jgi:hypothetical protein